MRKKLKSIFLSCATVIIAVVTIFAIVQAGNLEPPGSPAATMYTLSDIYTRLTTNATSTEGDHPFSPSASPASSMYTLTQIYNAIPTIVTNTVKLGTSYLGVTGTLTPDGGTAAVADLFNGKTAHLTADWTLDTGTLNLACNTATFDGVGNLVADAYDGTGTGLNRWCITDSGDTVAGDILFGKIAWVDGVAVTGSMTNVGQQIITASTTNLTITAGYHDGTGYALGDADLVVGNIKSGINIFNVIGTFKSLLPDTGQTGCWDAAGAIITCGSAPAGQDAEYTSSNSATCAPSYADNANGTITDNCTNLMWKKCSEGMTYNAGTGACDGAASIYTWALALGQCEGLTFPASSYTDWRLPNIKELMSIVNYQNAGPSINTTYFPGFVSGTYWSSTTDKVIPGNAWNVFFGSGDVDNDIKTTYDRVHCVRGQ